MATHSSIIAQRIPWATVHEIAELDTTEGLFHFFLLLLVSVFFFFFMKSVNPIPYRVSSYIGKDLG